MVKIGNLSLENRGRTVKPTYLELRSSTSRREDVAKSIQTSSCCIMSRVASCIRVRSTVDEVNRHPRVLLAIKSPRAKTARLVPERIDKAAPSLQNRPYPAGEGTAEAHPDQRRARDRQVHVRDVPRAGAGHTEVHLDGYGEGGDALLRPREHLATPAPFVVR